MYPYIFHRTFQSLLNSPFLPLINKMAEPQPSTIHEGAPDPTDEPPATAPPASAEDRKAAAALSSLDSHATAEEDASAEKKKAKNIDQEALSKAIARLELSSGKKDSSGAGVVAGEMSEREKRDEERKRKVREEKERRAKIKVDGGDVNLLVSTGTFLPLVLGWKDEDKIC